MLFRPGPLVVPSPVVLGATLDGVGVMSPRRMTTALVRGGPGGIFVAMASYFFVKLIGPRPTFAQDMSDEERQLMAQHTKYLFGAYEAGTLHIYGPVLAPEGAFGMAVVAAADEAEVRKLMDADRRCSRG